MFFELDSGFSASAVLISTQLEKLVQEEYRRWYSVMFVRCILLQREEMSLLLLLISMERWLIAYENES